MSVNWLVDLSISACYNFLEGWEDLHFHALIGALVQIKVSVHICTYIELLRYLLRPHALQEEEVELEISWL